MELFASDAYVQFTGLQNEDDGTVSVYFDYFIDGCRVYAGNDGHGGTVVFENGQLTQMTLYFRTYVSTGIETELLREIQAAAAAGGSAKIGYSDNGADVIYPQWFVAQE